MVKEAEYIEKLNELVKAKKADESILTTINDKLLDTKLDNSPYGSKYKESSYVRYDADNNAYYICLVDDKGNGIAETAYSALNRESVTTGVTCTTPTGA